jgi:hypothetical protein
MRHLLLLAALSCVAAAQNSAGISAPVSRTVTLAADEATFTIAIAATLDSTPQQVKQALQNIGLPNPTVVAIGLGQDSTQIMRDKVLALYSASVVIAAGSVIDAAKRLEGIRTQTPPPLEKLQYSVALNPSQATVDAMRQVVLPQLVEQARKLAQSLAAGSGLKLGAIRSISDSGAGQFLLAANRVSGDFSQLLVPYTLPSSMQYTYTLNLVFAAAP